MRHVVLSSIIVLTILAGPVLAAMGGAPRAGDPVVVVGPDPEAIVARAGGMALGPSRAPLGILAVAPDRGYADRLDAAGAWLVLDGRALAALCGITT